MLSRVLTLPALRRSRALAALGLVGLLLSATAAAVPKADLWSFWDPSDSASTVQVDHSTWGSLLDDHVTTLPDGRTVLDYQGMAADRSQLEAYLTALTALDPRTLNRNEQMAYWINLYNALTVRVVLDNPKKKSILRMGGGWLPTGPWDDTVTAIAGESLTLNDIEHRILRPIWRDHRIHFAVNCASVGCPNLGAEPFQADRLDEQLDAAEIAFLNHPRGLNFEKGKLRLSSIFDWYMEDFADSRDALLQYLAGVEGTDSDRITAYDGNIRYRYDWDLNATP